jgi:hypothetical protein
MNAWLNFRRLLRRSSIADAEAPLSNETLQPIASAALAELERSLDIWMVRGREREAREPSKELAVDGQRVEAEVGRFFGREALQHVQSSASEPVNGTGILFADRLFVAFLGRSAAMAVTRKLYSRLT